VSARRLRPVDLVREHGLSAQAVGNYEEEGILPTAGRTRHGYRIYTPLHARALRAAFVALVPAHGHGTATDDDACGERRRRRRGAHTAG